MSSTIIAIALALQANYPHARILERYASPVFNVQTKALECSSEELFDDEHSEFNNQNFEYIDEDSVYLEPEGKCLLFIAIDDSKASHYP